MRSLSVAMEKWKGIVIGAGATVALIGLWAAFRPELLFVNQQVNEKAPTAKSSESAVLATGSLKSYAHESMGNISIISAGGKQVLRLENFKTSNGPDVHVYLVKGSDASQDGVNKNGFLDLGSLKGNIGDQNYDLPAGFDLNTYAGVSIWCKRFGVDFAGATLKAPGTAFLAPSSSTARLAASFAVNPEIRVTGGTLAGKASGYVELIEANGKRFVRISRLHLPKGTFKILLVKAEDAKTTKEIKASPQIVLGDANKKGTSYPIDDKVDAWLYRTVSVWNVKTGQSIAIAHLRSDQELKKSFFLS